MLCETCIFCPRVEGEFAECRFHAPIASGSERKTIYPLMRDVNYCLGYQALKPAKFIARLCRWWREISVKVLNSE